jgi:general secretion pathway protein N
MAVIRLMRSLGAIFVICSVLATRAAAGAIDDRNDLRPQVEAGSPATQTNGVADPAGISRAPAPDPGAKLRDGNPLWRVPLSSLSATRDRPLFSASRRLPTVAAPVGTSAPQTQEALAPPSPERPLLTLVGTIVSRTGSVAVLQGPNTDAISRLRLGEKNDGWRVQGISLRSIVVQKGAQSVRLDLPRPNIAPAQ